MTFEQAVQRLYDRIAELSSLAIIRLPDIVLAIVVGLVALVAANRLNQVTQRLTRRVGGTPSLVHFFGRAVSGVVLLLGLIVVLNALGLSQVVISFVASLGVVGLVLGFALQDITRQLAAGALLLTLRPFEIGDDIEVKTYQGKIVDVKLLTTVLRSDDGLEVLIPNADVYTSPIINHSRYGMQRLEVVFKTPADTDLTQLEVHIRNNLGALTQIAQTPPLEIHWQAITPEGIEVAVRFWIDYRRSTVDEVRSEVVHQLVTIVQSMKGDKETRDKETGRQGDV